MDRYQRVKELFQAALDHDRRERTTFLAGACAGDTELRQEVEQLIALHDEAASFIEAPAVEAVLKALQEDRGPSSAGRQIGAYEIIREIGRGGMGAVYLASRADDQYKKRAAIKLIKRGMDTDDILRRFRNERQILASLSHPNIARLLDGGTTEDGLPYVVMEYIEGLPLLDYCDGARLSTAERLQLFRKICAAVHHAHQNLVVHRDLKPSNILVSSDGEPKLLDFGIAKFLNPEMSPQTIAPTVTAMRLMTRDCASPEQVRGELITTASDIYSLGVLLYELLTGHHPYQFKTPLPHEIERVICESIPEKPSAMVSHTEILEALDGAAITITPESVSRTREGQPEKLKRALSGDLDNIILMALRKEPQRRYASVAEFSEDLRRHLEGLPVSATKDTFGYRASKFIKRNKIAVTATAIVVSALLVGIVATAWQSRVARQERDKARIAQAKAERIKTFLQDMLGAASPLTQGKDVKVIDVLKDSVEGVETELADQPEVKADVMLTIGKTYAGLGQLMEAEKYLREALDINLKMFGEEHPSTVSSMTYLSGTLFYSDKLEEAERLARKALINGRKLYPEGHEDLAGALFTLGTILGQKGELKESEALLEEALDMYKKFRGEDDGYVVGCLNGLGYARQVSGDVEGAKSMYRQAIAIGRRTRLRERMWLAQALFQYGGLLIGSKEFAEAENILRESAEGYRVEAGESSLPLGYAMSYLGTLYIAEEDYQKAEAAFTKSREILLKTAQKEDSYLLSTTAGLGVTLLHEGRPVEAESLLRESWEVRKRALPSGHWLTANNESLIGECLLEQKKYLAAEVMLKNGYEGLKTVAGDKNPKTIDALQRLIKLYNSINKPALVAQYRAQLQAPSK